MQSLATMVVGYGYDDCGSCGRKNQKTPNAADTKNAMLSVPVQTPFSGFLNCEGTANTSLNPSGFVTVVDAKLPARSRTGELIVVGTQVRVVDTTAFGVIVQDTRTVVQPDVES